MSVIRIDKSEQKQTEQDLAQTGNIENNPTKENPTGNDVKDASQKKPIEIVVDGPLGHTYTAVLSAIYAKESMLFEKAVDVEKNSVIEIDEKQKNEVADAYIYTVNADQLESKSGSEIVNQLQIALDKHQANTKYIAIEEKRNNPKVRASLECFTSQGVKVIRNRNGIGKVFHG